MKKLDFAAIAIESAGLAAGGTASMLAYKELPKLLGDKVNPKYIPFIVIAAGALVPPLIGKKNEIIKNIGRGMVARAGSDIMANALGIDAPATVSGIGDVPFGNRTAYSYNDAVAGMPDGQTNTM